MEYLLHIRLQRHDRHRLRHPVNDIRNAQDPRSALLGDFHRADRTGEIRSRRHPIPQFIEVILHPLLKLPDRHAVDPGRSSVLLDFQPRIPHHLLGDDVRLAFWHRLIHAIPSLPVDHIHQPGRPRPLAPPPLRYAEASRLLRASPPACPATVLNSLRIRRLEVSLSPTATLAAVSGHAFTGSAREPGPSSCCLYAGHHLGSKRVTPRFIPGWRRDPGFDVTCIHFGASDGRGPFPAHRSSSRPTPDVIRSRLFSHRSTPRSSAKAPVSGLRPPPRKAAPEVQNFLHLLVQHRGPRATLTHLPRSCSQRRRECPPCVSGEREHRAVAVGGVADQHGLRRGHLYALSAVVA